MCIYIYIYIHTHTHIYICINLKIKLYPCKVHQPYLEPSNYVKKQPFHENSLFQEMDPKTARGAEFG